MNNYTAKPPKIIELETSSLCNLKCVMCPQSLTGKYGVQRPNHLPELIVDKVIPYITDETECISLHGIGEPFLSKSFWKILPLLPVGCHSQCNTNMTVLMLGALLTHYEVVSVLSSLTFFLVFSLPLK